MLIDLRPKLVAFPFIFGGGEKNSSFPSKIELSLFWKCEGRSEAAGENGYLFHLPSLLSFLFLEEGEMAVCMPLNGGRGSGGQYRWSHRCGEETRPGENKRFFSVLRFPTCGEKKSFPFKKRKKEMDGIVGLMSLRRRWRGRRRCDVFWGFRLSSSFFFLLLSVLIDSGVYGNLRYVTKETEILRAGGKEGP